ncbi:hypothetical protein [Streptomyces sp. HUAS TT7]|uniref:hypothetical protein n=1 Tax=Streptomyces sp. HUAS TT7 TaxID=3447507 RepID=UPI003F65AC04
MSHAVRHTWPPPRLPVSDTPGLSLPRLSFTVETECAERTNKLVGGAARSLLAAIGAPAPVAQKVGDAATVAAHYLVGHSQQSRYQLRIHTDPAGITLAVTDYLERPVDGPPAWLPVARNGQFQRPAADPPHGKDHELDLHRTPDGHISLTHRTPWPRPATPQPAH